MNRRISAFFAVSVLLLSLVPAYNVLRARGKEPIRWGERAFMYNVDMMPALASRVLTPLGISTSPSEVIIGREGWLFLGDAHQESLSVDRAPQSEADHVVARRVADAMSGWDAYAKARGVRAFRLMFAPNKGSVYPEYMPAWARPASPSGYDALFAADAGGRFIDLRPVLQSAKARSPVPLYYATDTHWNFLGAGLAFQAFAKSVAADMPGVRWPGPESYSVVRVERRAGGDLARFLRIPGSFDDPEPLIAGITRPLQTTQYDFPTGRIIAQGGNPMVDTPQRPLLVKSPNALNAARVLWIRDSFGQAMSPLMAATFSDVLQIGTAAALGPDLVLAQLIDEFKPDYVLFTVVERLSRGEHMGRMPPGGRTVSPNAAGRPAGPVARATTTTTPSAVSAARVLTSQHLSANGPSGRYRVTGADPYLDFAFATPLDLARTTGLRVALTCDDGTPAVPVQVFWLLDGMEYFSEAQSMRLSLPTGNRIIDLAPVARTAGARRVQRVRIDTDAGETCTSLAFPPPVPLTVASGT